MDPPLITNGFATTQPPTPQHRDRPDRSLTAFAIIGVATLLAGLVYLLFGGSSPAWVHQSTDETIAMGTKHNADSIMALADRVGKAYHFDHFLLVVTTMREHALDLVHTADTLQEAFYALQRGAISPTLVSQPTIIEALEYIEEEASRYHMHLATRSVADTLMLPAFGVTNGSVLTVVIPVPVITATFQMHTFAQTPLITSVGNTSVLALPDPEHTAIAVSGRTADHVLISESELANCLRIRDTHMCANLPIRLDREESCLGALFSAHRSAIRSLCRFRPLPEQWHVARAQQGTYVVSSAQPLTLTTTCPAGSSSARHLPAGVYRVQVPPGCTSLSEHFSIAATLARFAEVELFKEVTWDAGEPLQWSAADLSNELAAVKAHAAHTSHKMDSVLADLARPSIGGFPWIHFSWASALLVLLLGIAAYCCCRYRTTNAATTHFVPVPAAAPAYNVAKDAVTLP